MRRALTTFGRKKWQRNRIWKRFLATDDSKKDDPIEVNTNDDTKRIVQDNSVDEVMSDVTSKVESKPQILSTSTQSLVDKYSEHLSQRDIEMLTVDFEGKKTSKPPQPDQPEVNENSDDTESEKKFAQKPKPLWTSFTDPMSQMLYFRNNKTLDLQWVHPEKPNEDPFSVAAKKRQDIWEKVPASKAILCSHTQTVLAFLMDAGICIGVGSLFGIAVSMEMYGNWLSPLLPTIGKTLSITSPTEWLEWAIYQPGLPLFITSTSLFGLLTYTVRDLLADNGTRSYGKRFAGLEILDKSSNVLPNRLQVFGRNIILASVYFPCAVLYGSGLYPAFAPLYTSIPCAFFIAEIALFAWKGHGIGDLMTNTKVIPVHRQTRQSRLTQKNKLDEL